MPGESTTEKRLSLNAFEFWELIQLSEDGREVFSSSLVPKTTSSSGFESELAKAGAQLLSETSRIYREFDQKRRIVVPEPVGLPN